MLIINFRLQKIQHTLIMPTWLLPIPWWLSPLLLLLQTVHSIIPSSPIHCTTAAANCTVSNAYGAWGDRRQCSANSILYPATEAELVAAVAHAARSRLRVKVVSAFSHTIPKLACPSSGSGATLLISTERLRSEVDVDAAGRVVTADAGVGLRELIDRVEEEGMSLSAAPYWEGVSVGGAVSTGSVGSSWWGEGGALHARVVGMRVVVGATAEEGFAKVLSLEEGDPLLDAARVSLGLLAAISKVKLSIEPAFKRSITYNFTNDGELEEEFLNHAKTYEFGDITWYPSKHNAVYRYDQRVPLDTPGDAVFDFIGFQPQSILISKNIRATEKWFESTKNSKGKCAMAATTIAAKKLLGNGLKNNRLLFTGYPVVGRQGKMQTSGSCLYSPAIDTSCAWDPRFNGLFFYETTAIFPATTFASFICDVKRLRDLDPKAFCGIDIYNGFLIRFVRGSTAFLAPDVDSVVVDFNYFRADSSQTPRLWEDTYEEVEQMAFYKYGARPHWGKNRQVAFFGVQSKYGNMKKFLRAKEELDPLGLFSSKWSDEVLLGVEGGKFDGCALEGRCICSEDRHCSPDNGYYCRAGYVYQEGRVCRYVETTYV